MTSFSILREPLDRARSQYTYCLEGGNGRPRDKQTCSWVRELAASSDDPRVGFEAFLEAMAAGKAGQLGIVQRSKLNACIVVRPQSEFVLADAEDADSVEVDHLLCTERLDEDWARLQRAADCR